MALTVVLGPAAGGKTQALVERAAARYRADVFAPTLVLVPTGRHADQFRRRLVGEVPAVFGLEVSTLGGWARETVAASGTRVAARGVVAGLVRQAIVAATDAGKAQAFAPIRTTRGLQVRVDEAIRELVAEAIAPADLAAAAAATGLPPLIALADVYAPLLDAADAAAVAHPAATALLAARAMAAGTVAVPPLVLVDGFDYLHEGEVAFVAALADAGEVMVALDPASTARAQSVLERLLDRVPHATLERVDRPAPVPQQASFVAGDRNAELRALARDIKDRLTADRSLRPSDFAVAFRQATPRLPLARQVFAEYNLPLDPAAGFPLAGLPFGTWARRLLRLGADGWRLRDLVAVLRSDAMNRARWGMRRGNIAAIARQGRENKLWSGLPALRAIAQGLEVSERERDREAAAALSACLDDLGPLLDPLQEGSPATFARALETALFGPRPIARPASDTRAPMEAFRGLLRARIEADEVLGSAEAKFEEFSAWLVEDMEHMTLALREAGGVVLAPLHTLHGLRFRHLAVGGLAEGEFPAPRRLPGLLDGDTRAALIAAGLALPAAPRAGEDELFASAVARADATLVLSRPRLDPDGKPRAASHFFPPDGSAVDEPRAPMPEQAASLPELALALARAWPADERRPRGYEAWPAIRRAAVVEARRRSFETIGEYEGQLPPGMAGRLVAPEVKWSASRLESYVGCPFDFVAKYGLGLKELDEELVQADAALTGTVVHEILQDAVRPLVDSRLPLSPETLPAVLARVDGPGRETWETAPDRHGFGRAGLWRIRWPKTRDRIHRLLEDEAAAGDRLGVERVAGVEREVDTTIALPDGPMRFFGKIDRLDEARGTAVVVDYKSGRPIAEKDVEAAESLQLQLYAEAILAEGPRFDRVVARFVYLRPTKERDRYELDTAEPAGAERVRKALERVAEIRGRTREGRFEVLAKPFADASAPRACPDYCVFKYVCRGTAFARWKTWR